MKPTIGFVGVGRMGANMARRLNECRYKVSAVADAHPKTAQALAEELGSTAFTKLSEVTAHADIIFTVVTDDDAMRAIFLRGDDNLLKGAKGKTFVNCATVSPAVHVEIDRAARQKRARVLEACMASSISQARDGTLYLMCGGDEETYDAVKKVLKKLSVRKRFVGPAGRAAEVKALVNMVMNINTAGLAEGLGLGAALGHDVAMLREVFAQTGANSRVLETDGEDMQNREHDCWFSAAHAAKDSGIAADLAAAAGLSLPVNDATRHQFGRMVQEGLGGLDKSGVAELTFPGRHGSKPKAKKKAAPKRAAKKKSAAAPKKKRAPAKKKARKAKRAPAKKTS